MLHFQELRAAEDKARHDRVGMWSQGRSTRAPPRFIAACGCQRLTSAAVTEQGGRNGLAACSGYHETSVGLKGDESFAHRRTSGRIAYLSCGNQSLRCKPGLTCACFLCLSFAGRFVCRHRKAYLQVSGPRDRGGSRSVVGALRLLAVAEGDGNTVILSALEDYVPVSRKRPSRVRTGQYRKLLQALSTPVAELHISARPAST